MRALVTGAGRGIGLAIAERLVEDLYEVVCLDIVGEGTVACDVGDAIAVERVAAEVGPVDVLVNNTGVWSYGDLANTAVEEFERVIRVNLLGTMNCTRSFGKGMVARGAGAIVNIASISAIAPSPSVGAYSASKAAVVALTQQTALDWGPHGIRCNAVGPGMIRTESTASAYQDPVVEQARANAVPSGRLGTPREVANVVAFLASDQATYVNGQVIYVDGGLTQALFSLFPYPARPEGPQSDAG